MFTGASIIDLLIYNLSLLLVLCTNDRCLILCVLNKSYIFIFDLKIDRLFREYLIFNCTYCAELYVRHLMCVCVISTCCAYV